MRHGLQFTCVVFLLAIVGCGSSGGSIDQVGGYVLVYELEDAQPGGGEAMTAALRQRLHEFGFRSATVKPLAGDRVEITLPGLATEELPAAQVAIAMVGTLELRILAEQGLDDAVIAAATSPTEAGEGSERDLEQESMLESKWVTYDEEDLAATPTMVTRTTGDNQREVLVLLDQWDLTGDHLQQVRASLDQNGQPCLGATLSPQGTALMRELSSQNLPDSQTGRGRHLGIILDDQLMSAPRIASVIGSAFQITGDFSRQEIDTLVAVLRAGRLPGRLKKDPVEVIQVAPKR